MAHFLTETQTGFMKGRSILHGFHYAQDVITAAATDKFQMALFKADLNKAFDSIEWDFFMRCLQALYFPPNGHKRNQPNSRPMPLANWNLVTRSKKLGGLGVRDMNSANASLLVK
jgi:Reverse transcriptase (RNA-dependent DNA polymerase)